VESTTRSPAVVTIAAALPLTAVPALALAHEGQVTVRLALAIAQLTCAADDLLPFGDLHGYTYDDQSGVFEPYERREAVVEE
jgi:hypothetical protein